MKKMTMKTKGLILASYFALTALGNALVPGSADDAPDAEFAGVGESLSKAGDNFVSLSAALYNGYERSNPREGAAKKVGLSQDALERLTRDYHTGGEASAFSVSPAAVGEMR